MTPEAETKTMKAAEAALAEAEARAAAAEAALAEAKAAAAQAALAEDPFSRSFLCLSVCLLPFLLS